jgi:hypothetical protein
MMMASSRGAARRIAAGLAVGPMITLGGLGQAQMLPSSGIVAFIEL